MDIMKNQATVTHPSLYAAITLARIVQQVRQRLKARVKRNRACTQPSALCQSLEVHALTSISRALKPKSIYDTHAGGVTVLPSSLPAERSASSYLKVLNELDRNATRPVFSLSSVASKDELFLRFDAQRLIKNATIKRLRHVFDTSTWLLGSFQDAWNFGATSHQEACFAMDNTRRGKFVLNLEHMLLCLQQAALQAIIWRSLGFLEDEIHRWREHWQQQKQFCDSWFCEWPSGRRPLSTTWPWNIKSSLVVLWGVCWMFYGNLLSHNEATGEAGEGNRQWQQPPASQPNMQTFNDNPWLSSYVDNMQRSQPGRNFGPVVSRVSNETGSLTSAMLNTSSGAGISNSDTLSSQARRRSVGNSYISPTTPSSAASFLTSTSIWPPEAGTTFAANAAPDTGYEWPSDLSQLNITTSNLQIPLSNSSPSPYAANYNTPITDTSPNDLYYHYSGNPGINSGLRPLMHDNYPSPQCSDGSERAPSICRSVPINLQTENSHNVSPTTKPSPDSHQDDKGDKEPPRNAQGEICCSRRECSAKNLTFSRKCEWTKHMDKHTRPYVCEESGCEKIQGFTYSGGLLRHQREVHKQHGGPKAPKMCPHRDCKRSTGTGFSRKENLQEHLRRVHRGVGAPDHEAATITGTGALATSQVTPEVSTRVPRGKRARHAIEGDEGIDDEMGELQAEVKRLKKEAQEKDTRLMNLEALVQSMLPQGQVRRGQV